MISLSTAGTSWLTESIKLMHQLLALATVGFAVGGDHPLVDAPGRLNLDVLIEGEQVDEAVRLHVGEQPGAGVQGTPGGVERVALAAAVAVDGLLDPAPHLSSASPASRTTWKGLCRGRHNPFYADVLVMPMSARKPCAGWAFGLVRSA